MKNPPVRASHLASLIDNLTETLTLLDIHADTVGRGPGRKVGVEVLNKSAIVLVVASWEAYVEDTASSALSFLIEHASSHDAIPKNVLERVGQKYQGVNSWKLAGDGWKKCLQDNYKEVLSSTTGKLNTPKPSQVDELFAKTIGLTNLSKHWKWSGRPNEKCISALERLIELRGSIAHRVKHHDKVWKKDVREAVDLVSRIAARTSNVTRDYVSKTVGEQPWHFVKYKGFG